MFDLQPAKLLLALHFPELPGLFKKPFAFTPARISEAFADLAPHTLDVLLPKGFLTPGAPWSARCLGVWRHAAGFGRGLSHALPVSVFPQTCRGRGVARRFQREERSAEPRGARHSEQEPRDYLAPVAARCFWAKRSGGGSRARLVWRRC